MNLADVMTTSVVTVSMDDNLRHIRQIFDRYRFHHVIVVENGKAVGIISDRDVLKHLSPFIGKLSERAQDVDCLNRRAHQIMTRRLTHATPETPVADALVLMIQNDISCLPVLNDQGKCTGIVTSRDMLRWCTRCAVPSQAAPVPAAAPRRPGPICGGVNPLGRVPEHYPPHNVVYHYFRGSFANSRHGLHAVTGPGPFCRVSISCGWRSHRTRPFLSADADRRKEMHCMELFRTRRGALLPAFALAMVPPCASAQDLAGFTVFRTGFAGAAYMASPPASRSASSSPSSTAPSASSRTACSSPRPSSTSAPASARTTV